MVSLIMVIVVCGILVFQTQMRPLEVVCYVLLAVALVLAVYPRVLPLW
jgi:EamA domain-containing membrane protein RarD